LTVRQQHRRKQRSKSRQFSPKEALLRQMKQIW